MCQTFKTKQCARLSNDSPWGWSSDRVPFPTWIQALFGWCLQQLFWFTLLHLIFWLLSRAQGVNLAGHGCVHLLPYARNEKERNIGKWSERRTYLGRPCVKLHRNIFWLLVEMMLESLSLDIVLLLKPITSGKEIWQSLGLTRTEAPQDTTMGQNTM